MSIDIIYPITDFIYNYTRTGTLPWWHTYTCSGRVWIEEARNACHGFILYKHRLYYSGGAERTDCRFDYYRPIAAYRVVLLVSGRTHCYRRIRTLRHGIHACQTVGPRSIYEDCVVRRCWIKQCGVKQCFGLVSKKTMSSSINGSWQWSFTSFGVL